MSYKIDHHDGSETLAEQTIEWPFLKAQRDGGDPEVSTAAASDNESTRPSSTGPPCNNGTGSHYEIVVSNNGQAHDMFSRIFLNKNLQKFSTKYVSCNICSYFLK